MTDPIRPTDDEARTLARQLMQDARYAAMGVIQDNGLPLVTRTGFGLSTAGAPLCLVSALSAHTRALQANPGCSLLVGEPGPKGDPLNHPRLSLTGMMSFVRHGGPGHAGMAAAYLRSHPKAKLYIGFADFAFVRITPRQGLLNGGFGRAFQLTSKDLADLSP